MRSKFERSEARESELTERFGAAKTGLEAALATANDETAGLRHALDASKRREESALARSEQAAEKYAQVKQMVRHLAEANGQVARVYAALGSRLTEVRAAQAAARGGIEASREGLLFLQAQVDEARAKDNLDRRMAQETSELLRQRDLRCSEVQEQLDEATSSRDAAVREVDKLSRGMVEQTGRANEHEKSIIRLNAELVQTRNQVRKQKVRADKAATEVLGLRRDVTRVGAELSAARAQYQADMDTWQRKKDEAMADADMQLEEERAARQAEDAAATRRQGDADEKMAALQSAMQRMEADANALKAEARARASAERAAAAKCAAAERERERLRTERNELAEETQDRKEMYLAASERLEAEVGRLRERLAAAEADAERESGRAEAMQRLAAVLRERAATASKAATRAEVQVVEMREEREAEAARLRREDEEMEARTAAEKASSAARQRRSVRREVVDENYP